MEILRTFIDIRLAWQHLATNSPRCVISVLQIKDTLQTLTNTFDTLLRESHANDPMQVYSTTLSDVCVSFAPHLQNRWLHIDIHIVCQDDILSCVYMNHLRRTHVRPEKAHIELPLNDNGDVTLIFKRGVLLEMNEPCVLRIRSHPKSPPPVRSLVDWMGNALRLNYVTSSSGDVTNIDAQSAISVCSLMDQQLATLTSILDATAGRIAKLQTLTPTTLSRTQHAHHVSYNTGHATPSEFRYS